MKYIIKCGLDFWNKVRGYLLQNELEQIAYLFCHTAKSDNIVVIYPKKMIVFPQTKDTQEQAVTGVRLKYELAREMYIRFAESDYTAIINCHSHPFDHGNVWFSGMDDTGDIADTTFFHQTLPGWKSKNKKSTDVDFFSCVFGQTSVAARCYNMQKKEFFPLDTIVTLHDHVEHIIPSNAKKPRMNVQEEIFNRQILAFGREGQQVISGITAALVGIGGLGSIVAEGLGRLGVRQFILIDDDTIELSNLNRFQGANASDVGKSKVQVVRDRLLAMFAGSQVVCVQKSLFHQEAVAALKHADVLIGAADTKEARFFLNRLSCQYMIPLIDSGVVIRTKEEKISGLLSRVTVVIPGLTRCLDCSGVRCYNHEDIRNFFMDAATQRNMVAQGYIENVPDIPAPSVYPLNMMAASSLLFEFLNLFTSYKETAWNVLLDYLTLNEPGDKMLGTMNNFEMPTGTCLNCRAYLGTGDSESLSFFLNLSKELEFPDYGTTTS